MKDLRIVIVSWNVEELLGPCLRSLPNACGSLDWECVVVDNASKDESVHLVRRIAEDEAHVSVIANYKNVGFAKACNQGTHGSDARFVLYLNPDTVCDEGSLMKLVHIADEHPKTAIFGPKLVYPNGTYQESVRRFPDVWSQAGILLKLHHVFPFWKPFRKYFAKDLETQKEQTVDQVMGACFLVRREFLLETNGFDERYFIWFEEVDWCKTARQRGWEIRYVPQVEVVHHGGESFGQVLTLQKQRYYNRSLISYFQKWHAGWRVALLKCLSPISVAEAWVVGALRIPVVRWSVFVLALEAVSALTIFHPVANSVAVFVLSIIVFLLAWKNPVPALGILFLELLIGSKGQLLQFGDWPVTTSLRICLVAAFLLGWGIGVIQEKRWKSLPHILRGRGQYVALFILISWGFLRGWQMHNAQALQDGNAWLDWVLLVPILDVALRYREKIRQALVPVLFVGICWLALKTIGLEYLFSHGFKSIASNAYLWVRRTGVGEVTYMLGDAFRIFEQSFVYVTAAWLLGVAWLLTHGREMKRQHRIAFSIVLAATFVLSISLSRSFWLGTAVGAIVLMLLVLKKSDMQWKRLTSPILASIAGVIVIAATLAFPFPPVKIASLVDLFGSRANTEEAAAASRWHLLPILGQKILQHPILGSGYGATVTYQSEDPRVIKDTGNGIYTTYAFEWGWLEHWVKFGVIGIPVILWLLVSLMKRLWGLEEPLWLRAGAVSSLVALATLHLLTPYLNHPLGFLYFFVGEVVIVTSHATKRTS